MLSVCANLKFSPLCTYSSAWKSDCFTAWVSWLSVLFQVHVFSAWMGRSAQTWLTAQEAQDRVIPEEAFIKQPPESLLLLQQVLLWQGKQAEWEGRQSQGQEAQVCRSRERGRERRRGGTGQERGSWFGCQVPHTTLQGWPLRQQGNSSPGRLHGVIMWCARVCSHSPWFLQMNISRYRPQHQMFAPVSHFSLTKACTSTELTSSFKRSRMEAAVVLTDSCFFASVSWLILKASSERTLNENGVVLWVGWTVDFKTQVLNYVYSFHSLWGMEG